MVIPPGNSIILMGGSKVPIYEVDEAVEEEKKPAKAKNPKGTITLNEAMSILNGRYRTKTGLREAAVRDGFKSHHKGSGMESYLLDEVKFRKWIRETIDAIPAGFYLISVAAKELGVTTAYVYDLIKQCKIKTRKIGTGKGRLYVDFAELRNICKIKKRG